VEANGKTYSIKMYNPHILEVPDPSGGHEDLIAFTAWHPESNMMVYSLAGYSNGNINTYDPTGYELWSRKDSAGDEDPHTPQIVTAIPLSFDSSGVTVDDTSGWQARGQFEGVPQGGMTLQSHAVIYEGRPDDIHADLYTTYSAGLESDHVFRDKNTVRGLESED
jgi:hypothetical protein